MRKILTCTILSLSFAPSALAQQNNHSSHNGSLPKPQNEPDNPNLHNGPPAVREVPTQSKETSVLQAFPANSAKQSNSNLLSTASMIGAMKDPENLFSRLQIPNDWRAEEQIIPTGTRVSRDMALWNPMAYTWTSPVFYHRPLYFEQPNLERYGNGPRRLFQPAISSAHFFMSAPLIPVKMLYNAPWSDIYTLGEGRPGNWVPWQTHAFLEE